MVYCAYGLGYLCVGLFIQKLKLFVGQKLDDCHSNDSSCY